MIRGTDVSSVQGKVDWARMKASGLDFAIIKIHEGNKATDPNAASNVAGARAAGLTALGYHFAYPLPHLDPVAQAATFVAAHDKAGLSGTPMFLDFEWPAPFVNTPGAKGWKEWGCTATQLNDWFRRCAEAIAQATGIDPVIYTYPWFFREITKGADTRWAARYGLWLASYVAGWPKEGQDPPNCPAPWAKGDWLFWQWDGNGGLRMPDGRDADFNVFNGGSEAFDRWASGLEFR